MPKPEPILPDPAPAALAALDAATALAAAGDADRARELALPLLGEPALHVRALVLLQEIARRRGEAAEAARLAARAARLAPKSPRALALCAMAATDAGRHGEALAKAREALARDPDETLAAAAGMLAALRLDQPLAAKDAALGVLAAPDCPAEVASLAATVLGNLAQGRPFGLIRCEQGDLVGLARTGTAAPADVDLLVDGAPLARLTADIPFCPKAGLLAFRFSPPATLAPGTTVEARLAATGQALFGSPVALPAARTGPAAGPRRGQAALADDGRLSGYRFDPAAPGKRLAVAFFADGEPSPRLTATAEGFAAGLLEKGLGDGRFAFAVDWPHEAGTACRRVHVRDAATGEALAGSPVLVPHPREAGPTLARLCAWLRQAGQNPDAPPPLPPECRGALLDFARSELAARVARFEAAATDASEASHG
ncbi:MAG: hypothetical protein ACP59X_08050 [Solidesulfovibrio sp. DCME]|uniref:hypothetical protein n=1 Tax=Solidesulfovibrio sp. DCME TaxID=3447380 RepID=UPI003D0E10AB